MKEERFSLAPLWWMHFEYLVSSCDTRLGVRAVVHPCRLVAAAVARGDSAL